jgi:CheY-like chemotaxis protein
MNLQQLNILLADDDTDDRIFFAKALEELTIAANLVSVHDGEQLMNLLIKGTTELPDVLFLDLNMPRKNGFECLSEIKLNDRLKELPVIIFSTSFEQEVVNLLYENGALYFIRKPSEFSKFKRIILQSLALVAPGRGLRPCREDFVLVLQEPLAA